MNEDFSIIRQGSIETLVYAPWWKRGIIHGMTMKPLRFARGDAQGCVASLLASVGGTHLAVPDQCHGTEHVDMREQHVRSGIRLEHGDDLVRFRSADALIAPSHGGGGMVFGVMSADCVPILVRGESGWAAIHAGWRGLAQGIIEATLRALGEPLEGVVFASAGGERYEVGQEVIDALGASGSYRRASVNTPGGGFLLDTAGTAINQLRLFEPGLKLAVSAGICTISDDRFHSYRREGEAAGRCMTFIFPPA